MIPIGIMQGRLSPQSGGRIQSFPVTTWREEFGFAREAGLDTIEWIYEAETEASNPLGSDDGLTEILSVVDRTDMRVSSICADCYMENPLVTADGIPQIDAQQHLRWLIRRAARLGVRHIVLPFVDRSSLRVPVQRTGLHTVLRAVLRDAEAARIELHLETDLAPADVVAILEVTNHPLLRANYDIGNSAALGHDPAEELTMLAPWLGSVHVKDRLLGGGSVPLGTGAADFRTCFRLMDKAGFRGPYILQTARVDELNEIDLAIENRRFVEQHVLGEAQR